MDTISEADLHQFYRPKSKIHKTEETLRPQVEKDVKEPKRRSRQEVARAVDKISPIARGNYFDEPCKTVTIRWQKDLEGTELHAKRAQSGVVRTSQRSAYSQMRNCLTINSNYLQ